MLDELLAPYAGDLECHLDYIVRTRDGTLFLAGGAHSTFAYKLGMMQVEPASFEAFETNLLARMKYCADRGITYLHAITPDKETVMTASLPVGMQLTSLIDRYREACTVPFLDLRPDVPVDDAFYRTDSHWYLPLQQQAGLRMARMLGADEAEIAAADARLTAARGETVDYSGDLGSQIEPQQTEKIQRFHPNWAKGTWLKTVGGWNDGMMHIFRNPAAPPRRLLVFGDSFGRATCNHLSLFFSEILFCRSGHFHKEMVDMMQPTHVLTQQVERFLDRVYPDAEAPRFLLIPGVNGTDAEAWPAFWQDLNAVLSPRVEPVPEIELTPLQSFVARLFRIPTA